MDIKSSKTSKKELKTAKKKHIERTFCGHCHHRNALVGKTWGSMTTGFMDGHVEPLKAVEVKNDGI